MIENDHVRIIDPSTAHRTEPGWAYGFPELSPNHRQAVETGKRVAVPGCHATGFISWCILSSPTGTAADTPVSCFSLTGYSGGGKKMIADYEGEGRSPELDAPRIYGLGQQHKHLKEMQAITGLEKPPIFSSHCGGLLQRNAGFPAPLWRDAEGGPFHEGGVGTAG